MNGQELERLGAGQGFGEVSFINQCKLRKRGVEPEEAKAQCLRGADIETLERCELLALSCDDAWPLIKLSPNLWCNPSPAKARSCPATCLCPLCFCFFFSSALLPPPCPTGSATVGR